jgi:hypothetical protein
MGHLVSKVSALEKREKREFSKAYGGVLLKAMLTV